MLNSFVTSTDTEMEEVPNTMSQVAVESVLQ